MTSTTALMGLGEMRRRQEAAKQRGKRFEVDPETRAVRAAIMEKRDAIYEQQQAETKAERDASPDALRAVLSRGSVDELAEIARMIGRLDGRRLQVIADEVFRERSRTGYTPDGSVPAPVASAADVAEIALGAGGSARASSSHRKG